MGNYIDEAMLRNRLSAAVVRRIYDDNNDGIADADPMTQLIEDAEGRFEAYCSGIYPDLTALRASGSNEARRLVLDLAEAMACRRFPKAANREWLPLWQAIEAELKGLRRRETRLDITTAPEPASNEGGAVYKEGAEVASGDDYKPFFMDGTGLF